MMNPENIPMATAESVSEIPEYNRHPKTIMSPQDLLDFEEMRKKVGEDLNA